MRRSLIAAVVSVSVALIGVEPAWAAAHPASQGEMTDAQRRALSQKLHPDHGDVPLLSTTPVGGSRTSAAQPLANGSPASAVWPGAGNARLTAAAGKAAKVAPGGLNVSARRHTPDPQGRALGLDINVLDHQSATAAGVDGVLLSVSGGDSTPIDLSVGYQGFAHAYGGDWSSRLRLVQMPPCALTTPSDSACRTQTPLATSSNDIATATVTAQVLAASANVVALTSSTSGSSGSWSATPLSSSASWQVGEQTGDFTWSYPLTMPPTQGGPTPSLALGYDSGSLDGRVASTNNQTSWIGDGWDVTSGYVERKYVSCADDATGNANNVGQPTGDLCWGPDNATLVLGGHSTELVKDAATGTWKPKNDDGTRIEHLTGAWNTDNDTEYWKVTTTDGTQYWFGRDRRSASDPLALNSAWTVPVYGNNPGEPCYSASFADSWCNQAWRWNLDRVVDPSGNSMTYVYAAETNNYGRNNNTAVSSYVRGGYLTEIDYGQRAGSEASSPAPQRVTFTVAERCVPNGTIACDPAQLTSATASSWPDVPFDLICTSSSSCPNVTSPAFFTRKRLTTIATSVYTAGAYQPVDSWTLTHKFPDPGDSMSNPVLWLDSIQHTGAAPGTAVTLPAVTFTGVQMTNRVDTSENLGPRMNRWRVNAITDEMGSVTTVNYTAPDCTVSDLPASPDSNTRRCFPVQWVPQGSIGPVTEYFNKYLVAGVNVDNRDLASAIVQTAYTYSGGAAWHYDNSALTPPAQRTWAQFRGYGTVDVVTGASGTTQSHTLERFFRGMDGDHLASGATRSVSIDGIADSDRANGFTREQTVYDGASVVSTTLATPWISSPTATAADGTTATFLATGVSETHTTASALPGGQRVTRTVTSYDSTYGLPTQVDDQGDVATSSDDRCTRLTYARNAAANIVAAVSQTETVAVACAATPTRPGDVISDTRTFFDGGSFGAPPTQGLPTTTQTLSAYSGDTPVYTTTATTSYDANGRTTSVTDALGATTSTAYTPATGGPVTAVTTTSPDPDGSDPLTAHVSTTNLDPTRGVATSAVDPNGKTTTGTYDGLGRLTAVWLPGRALTSTASTTYAYQVNTNGRSSVTTQTLGQDGTYLTAVSIYDALGQVRQTQSLGQNRSVNAVLVTDTVRDSRGLASIVNDQWATAGSPSTTLLQPSAAVPSRTRYTYDGAGRVTTAAYDVDQQQKWVTTTSYGGDRVTTVPPAGETPTTTISDARGNTTSLVRYTTGSLTGPTQTVNYGYDKASRLAKVTDAAGNVWTYQYDLRGRKISASDPDKGTTINTYDDADRLTTTTDARGKTLWYGYDALGRKVAENSDSAAGTRLASWTYDTRAKGQLSSSTRYDNGNAYTSAVSGYDNAYQPTGASLTLPSAEGTLAGTYSVSYTYTLDEQLKTAVYSATANLPAETVTTTYDKLSLPEWMTGGMGKGVYVAGSTRDSFGGLQSLDLGNSYSDFLYYTYEEGTRRLLTQNVNRQTATGNDVAMTYTTDPAGNVTSITDAPTQPGVRGDTQCFSYDGLRRLTTAWTPATGGCAQTPTVAALGGAAPYWTDYSYDTAGNRTTTTAHAAAGTTTAIYTYPLPGASQPHAVTSVAATGPSGTSTSSFGYDQAGNTTNRQISGQAAQTLGWDREGRLSSVAVGSSSVESDLYSADGDRIIRRAGTQVTAYLPGGQELTLNTTTSTVSGLRYYSFAGQTIAVRNGTGLAAVTTLIPDNQGTAIASIADSSDVPTRRYADPFGAPRGTTPTTWVGDHGFLNKATDAAIGLTQVGARYLDTTLGRFISVDPVMDLLNPQQWGAYAYANNNPITLMDPTGLSPWDWVKKNASGIAGAAVGVVVGVVVTSACLAGTAGVGSVGCAALGGAAGGAAAGAVSNVIRTKVQHQGDFSWSGLARDTIVGGAVGGLTGGTFGAMSDALYSAAVLSEAAANTGSTVAADAASSAASTAATKATASAISSAAEQASTRQLAADSGETYFRTMSQAHFQQLSATGKLPATGETFISPTREFAARYNGVTVEFSVRNGTTQALTGIGVRDESVAAAARFPWMPQVAGGWGKTSAYFKWEGSQFNIGLGRGPALDIFNRNISSFRRIC